MKLWGAACGRDRPGGGGRGKAPRRPQHRAQMRVRKDMEQSNRIAGAPRRVLRRALLGLTAVAAAAVVAAPAVPAASGGAASGGGATASAFDRQGMWIW